MADGSNFTFSTHHAFGARTVGEALTPGLQLMATCAAPLCERRSVFDPAPWIGQGLQAMPLSALQDRVRCVCGSRSAWLEVCAGSGPAPTSELFIFR